MLTFVLAIVAAYLLVTLGPAKSDTVTARVAGWDNGSRTLTLEDRSKFSSIPEKFAVPQDLKADDRVTVEYDNSEHDSTLEIHSMSFIRSLRQAHAPSVPTE